MSGIFHAAGWLLSSGSFFILCSLEIFMGFFNMNSGFFKFMGRLVDVIWLNFLWLLFSIPLVTVGASTAAACYVTLKMVDDEEGYVGKSFVRAFKANFRQGTILWLITVVAVYALYIEWQFVTKMEDTSFLLILAAILSTAVVIFSLLYSFPLIARYENSVKNTIKNSFSISFRYFGRTVFLVFIIALEVCVFCWNRWMMLAGIIIGPMILIYTVSGISKRIFQKIEQLNRENDTE